MVRANGLWFFVEMENVLKRRFHFAPSESFQRSGDEMSREHVFTYQDVGVVVVGFSEIVHVERVGIPLSSLVVHDDSRPVETLSRRLERVVSLLFL